MATTKVAMPSFLCSLRLHCRTRLAWVASSTYQARPNSPCTTNFGSRLLGWVMLVKRLSENATTPSTSSTTVTTEKYAPHVLPAMTRLPEPWRQESSGRGRRARPADVAPVANVY